MSIGANKNKSDYALFLEKDINLDRTIKLYETDSEDELIEKWKQEPLSWKSQQKIWDLFPNTTLSKVIYLGHRMDNRFGIKSIGDLLYLNLTLQTLHTFEQCIDGNERLYHWTKEEMYDEMYYMRLKILQLQKEVKKLNEVCGAMSEAVYND